MRITKAEMAKLKEAAEWEGQGCGIHHCGRGATAAMLRRMEKKGLLAFAGFGPDAAEGWGPNSDREYPLWVLAPLGYETLAQAERGA